MEQFECPSLIKTINSDLLQGVKKKRLRIYELNDLGYLISGDALSMGKPIQYYLFQVTDNQHKLEVSFSFLYIVEEDYGFILPNNYSYYLNIYYKS